MNAVLFAQNEWRKGDSATWINNIWRLWSLLYTNQIPASAAHLINYPLCWAPQLASDHVRPLEAGQWPWDRPALPRGCLASPSKIFCQHALLAGQWPRLHSIVRCDVSKYGVIASQCHVYTFVDCKNVKHMCVFPPNNLGSTSYVLLDS